jgi:DoxX-like family
LVGSSLTRKGLRAPLGVADVRCRSHRVDSARDSLGVSAARKLTHAPYVVASYARAGVPEARLNQLATVLFVGAAGLLVGLWWSPLGVTAATGLFCYFLVAIAFHIGAGDLANLPMPVALAGMAALAAGLRVVTS